MQIAMPTGLGAVLAVIVLLLAILAIVGVGLPATAVWICIALLAVARLT